MLLYDTFSSILLSKSPEDTWESYIRWFNELYWIKKLLTDCFKFAVNSKTSEENVLVHILIEYEGVEVGIHAFISLDLGRKMNISNFI